MPIASSDFQPTVPNDAQKAAIQAINEKFFGLSVDVMFIVPNSAHRTAALRHLLDAKMTLIHAITHPDGQ